MNPPPRPDLNVTAIYKINTMEFEIFYVEKFSYLYVQDKSDLSISHYFKDLTFCNFHVVISDYCWNISIVSPVTDSDCSSTFLSSSYTI
jgi:hypothetical protein